MLVRRRNRPQGRRRADEEALVLFCKKEPENVHPSAVGHQGVQRVVGFGFGHAQAPAELQAVAAGEQEAPGEAANHTL